LSDDTPTTDRPSPVANRCKTQTNADEGGSAFCTRKSVLETTEDTENTEEPEFNLHFDICNLKSRLAVSFEEPRYWLLLGFFTLLYLAPIWIVRFLPFVDLPQHLSFVSILRSISNPATDYAKTFTIHLFPTQNVLHLFITYPLSFLLGIEPASKVFLSIYVILLPLAMDHLIRTLEGNRWFVFASLLFIYNFNLLWGFLSTAMAIPVLLFLISFELRWLGVTTPRTGKPNSWLLFLLSILFIVTFLGHSLIFLFAALLYLAVLGGSIGTGTALGRGTDWRRLGMGLIPLAPVVLLFVFPWQAGVFGSREENLVNLVLGGMRLQQWLARPGAFFSVIGLKADELSLLSYKAVLVLALTLVGVFAARQRFRSLFAGRLRLASLLVLVSFACYLFFPAAINQAWFLNERFAVFCCLFLIALAAMVGVPGTRSPGTANLELRTANCNPQSTDHSPRSAIRVMPPGGWAFLVLASVLLLNVVNTGYRFVVFDKAARPVAHLLKKLPPDRKLLGLTYELNTRPDLTGYEVFVHFPCYYQVWNRGYPGFSFASIRFSPVQYKDPSPFLAPGSEWAPWHQVFPKGWEFYDYFLVHGSIRLPDQEYIARCRLIGQEGGWAVYQRPGPEP
jgi:hypothetical protein